jgi:hypothetical protein
MTCGRFEGCIVATQNVLQPFIFFATQVHKRSPFLSSANPYPGANGRPAFGCEVERLLDLDIVRRRVVCFGIANYSTAESAFTAPFAGL